MKNNHKKSNCSVFLDSVVLSSLMVMIFFVTVSKCYSDSGGKNNFRDGKIAILQLQSTKVKDAARMISEFSGVNIVVTQMAGEVEVDLYLQNTSVEKIVEIICRSVSLAHQYDDESDVYYIMTIEQYTQDLVVVKEEVEVIELKFSRVSMIAEALSNLYPEQVMLTFIDSGSADQEQGVRSRLGGLSGGTGGGAGAGVGAGAGAGVGSSATGGSGVSSSQNTDVDGQGAANSGGMNLGPRVNLNQQLSSVLTSSRISNLEQGESQYSKSGEKHLGLDVNKPVIRITAIDENNILIIKSTDKKTVSDILKLIESLDRMVPQVFLKMSIYKIIHEEGQGKGIDWEFSAGSEHLELDKEGEAVVGREHVFRSGDVDFLDSSLVYRYVTEDLMARLNLFKKKNLVEVISSPLIMARNNEETRLFIGTELTLVTGFENETNLNQNVATTTTIVETEKRDVGNTLLITPKINSNRTVDLQLELDYSTVIRNGASIPVPINDGKAMGAFQIDLVDTTQIQGKVTGKHGVTMAIGGLMGKSDSDSNKEIPYLSGIPVVKHLFNVDTASEERSEMIVLVTPYLMENSDAFDTESLGRLSEYDLAKKLNGSDSREESNVSPKENTDQQNEELSDEIEQRTSPSPSSTPAKDVHEDDSRLKIEEVDESNDSDVGAQITEKTEEEKDTKTIVADLDEDGLELR